MRMSSVIRLIKETPPTIARTEPVYQNVSHRYRCWLITSYEEKTGILIRRCWHFQDHVCVRKSTSASFRLLGCLREGARGCYGGQSVRPGTVGTCFAQFSHHAQWTSPSQARRPLLMLMLNVIQEMWVFRARKWREIEDTCRTPKMGHSRLVWPAVLLTLFAFKWAYSG